MNFELGFYLKYPKSLSTNHSAIISNSVLNEHYYHCGMTLWLGVRDLIILFLLVLSLLTTYFFSNVRSPCLCEKIGMYLNFNELLQIWATLILVIILFLWQIIFVYKTNRWSCNNIACWRLEIMFIDRYGSYWWLDNSLGYSSLYCKHHLSKKQIFRVLTSVNWVSENQCLKSTIHRVTTLEDLFEVTYNLRFANQINCALRLSLFLYYWL